MGSRYSIIQYVPDPIANERINIGVVAFDDQTVTVRFLQDWKRVRDFGKAQDIKGLQDFATRMQGASEQGLLYPGDEDNGQARHERLKVIIRDWRNSLQFTELHGALLSPQELIDRVAADVLIEPQTIGLKRRDRQAAARAVRQVFHQTCAQRLGKSVTKELVKDDYLLEGRHKSHRLDVALANGKPYLAAHSISFEVHPPDVVMDALAFMITEIKAVQNRLPMAIVALPPIAGLKDNQAIQDNYQKMTRAYTEMGADVLNESEIEPWLTKQLDHLPMKELKQMAH